MREEPAPQRTTFLGFLARRRTPRPEWLNAPTVSEVWNVSLDSCEVVGTPGLNRFGFHDSVEDALDGTVPSGDMQVFGYSILSAESDGRSERPLGLTRTQGAGVPPTWRRVGYDVVATDGEMRAAVWCSPLFCNAVAAHVPTNAHCLIDDIGDAIELARHFAADEIAVEPGPYLVIEVIARPLDNDDRKARVQPPPGA